MLYWLSTAVLLLHLGNNGVLSDQPRHAKTHVSSAPQTIVSVPLNNAVLHQMQHITFTATPTPTPHSSGGGTPTPKNTPTTLPPHDTTNDRLSSFEPCHDTNYWTAHLSAWAIPPGCYGTAYSANAHNYPFRPEFGWCSWWAEETHLQYSGYTALHLPAHSTPIIGSVVRFAPGVAGASREGHYAGEVIAISGQWLLISEMNMSWRGGGFARISYRYIYLQQGITFLY